MCSNMNEKNDIEKNSALRAIRRTHLIDEEVSRLMDNVYTVDKICDNYSDGEELIDVVVYAVIENLYFHTFYNIFKNNDDNWNYAAKYIYDYVYEKYSVGIINYYKTACWGEV